MSMSMWPSPTHPVYRGARVRAHVHAHQTKPPQPVYRGARVRAHVNARLAALGVLSMVAEAAFPLDARGVERGSGRNHEGCS